VLRQFAEEPTGVITLVVTFAVASVIPVLLSAKPESFKVGPFTPGAEMINGRAAMLGLASMMLIEGGIGHALF
jgi:hypothetical protein